MPLATLITPLARFGLDPAEVLMGRCFEVIGGEDEDCWALTPLGAVWGKGGGGRFILGGCEVGFETAVAISEELFKLE